MKQQDKIRHIAEQKLSIKDTLIQLSDVGFSKFMFLGRSDDGNWSSFFANLDLQEASYAAVHANMVVQQQHALQIHRPDCPNASPEEKTS